MRIFKRRATRAQDVPDLLVVHGDPASDEALALVRRKNVSVQIVHVSGEDYLSPRDVPKLMTRTGIYFGLPSIERVIDDELLGRKAS